MNLNQRLHWILTVILAVTMAAPVRAQSDVLRAQQLSIFYRRAKIIDAQKKHPSGEIKAPQDLADTCRLFFTTLDQSSGPKRTVHDVYRDYADNPFVGEYARAMFRLWMKASAVLPPGPDNRMENSKAIQIGVDTMRYVRISLRQLLAAEWAGSKMGADWTTLTSRLGLTLPATLPKRADTLAVLLEHYDALLRPIATTQVSVQALLVDLQTRLAGGSPALAVGLTDLVSKTSSGSRGFDWVLTNYQNAVVKIRGFATNEFLATAPAASRVVVGLNSFTGTRYGLPASATLAAPPTPAAGPPAGWETAVLDGTARFVARRFREELSATFVQQFARLMSSRDTAYLHNLQLLFPATKDVLTSGSAPYAGALVQPLRAAMQRDLQGVMFRYGALLTSSGAALTDTIGSLDRALQATQQARANEAILQKTASGNKAMQKSMKTALDSAAEKVHDAEKVVTRLQQQYARRYAVLTALALRHLAEGQHPADLLMHLEEEVRQAGPLLPYAVGQAGYVRDTLLPVLHTLRSLSEALADTRSLRRAWVEEKELTALLRQPEQLVLFQGLVLARLNQSAPPTLQSLLWRVQQERGVESFQRLVFGFASLAVRFEAQVQTLNREEPSDTLARETRARTLLGLYQTTLGLVRFGAEEINRADAPALARLDALQNVGELVVQGYAAAQRQQYGQALTNLVQVVEKTVPRTVIDNRLNWPQVVRYGSVMAAVGVAKTPNEVQAALQAGALPSGSARVKRESLFTASLNAYAGITTGLEHIQDIGPSYNLGFMAAIGPCFTWGIHRPVGKGRLRTDRYIQARKHFGKRADPIGRREMRGTALGLFISVIDLGAPVLLHLSDDGYSTVPENVDFRHLFAPGAMLTYSLRNSPITLLAGAQFTGNLRQKTGDLAPKNSTRYNVSLAFDIPLVHFGVRTEAKPSN